MVPPIYPALLCIPKPCFASMAKFELGHVVIMVDKIAKALDPLGQKFASLQMPGGMAIARGPCLIERGWA
ncbi:MAG: hypothetical protein ABIQ90_11115 [Polaromonas sp.]